MRFHDLRHGAASLAKAAGVDTKLISAMLGHARRSFTDDVYVTVFPEVAKAAAEAAAAVVARAGRVQGEARKPRLSVAYRRLSSDRWITAAASRPVLAASRSSSRYFS